MAPGSGMERKDQTSPAESLAGLSTTVLSSSHRLPAAPLSKALPSTSCHTATLWLNFCLLPENVSPSSFPLIPHLWQEAHPHQTGARRPPGALRVGGTCAQAGSPSALAEASPQSPHSTRRWSWESSAPMTRLCPRQPGIDIVVPAPPAQLNQQSRLG